MARCARPRLFDYRSPDESSTDLTATSPIYMGCLEKSHLSRFDPAAYLSALTGVGVASGTSSDDAPAQEDDQALRGGKSVTRKEGTSMLTLSVMPIHLRRPVDAVLRLVVRDFVCYW